MNILITVNIYVSILFTFGLKEFAIILTTDAIGIVNKIISQKNIGNFLNIIRENAISSNISKKI